jgi:hypothetical protein
VKLFQIEEPDGSPVDTDMPGAAIGIDAGGTVAEIAIAVGGNPALLADRDGYALDLAVPASDAPPAAWQRLFEGARLRAERALARPVTHAVLIAPATADKGTAAALYTASSSTGIELLRILARADIPPAANPAFAAAILAEDLAPAPGAA